MEDFDFTETEIKEQLRQLGYANVSTEKLKEFKRDLENLVRHEKSKNSSGWSTMSESEQSRASDGYIQMRRPQTMPERNSQPQKSKSLPSSHYGSNSEPVRPLQNPREAFPMPTHSEGVPDRIEMAPPDSLDDSDVDTTLNTTGSTERRIMKRKVMRKVDGKSRVFDESSVTESDFTDDMSEVEDRLRAIPVTINERPKTAPSGERRRIFGIPAHDRPQTACARETPNYGVPNDYDGPKALIKPMVEHPNIKNIRRTDVVSRGEKYRNSWCNQRAPGEKNHKSLRWNVREQMLYHDKVVDKKQHRVFLPNKFKIPSDKKRKNLRWQVRQDLAQGVVPPSVYE